MSRFELSDTGRRELLVVGHSAVCDGVFKRVTVCDERADFLGVCFASFDASIGVQRDHDLKVLNLASIAFEGHLADRVSDLFKEVFERNHDHVICRVIRHVIRRIIYRVIAVIR